MHDTIVWIKLCIIIQWFFLAEATTNCNYPNVTATTEGPNSTVTISETAANTGSTFMILSITQHNKKMSDWKEKQ